MNSEIARRNTEVQPLLVCAPKASPMGPWMQTDGVFGESDMLALYEVSVDADRSCLRDCSSRDVADVRFMSTRRRSTDLDGAQTLEQGLANPLTRNVNLKPDVRIDRYFANQSSKSLMLLPRTTKGAKTSAKNA